VDRASQVDSRVIIEKGAEVINSVIRGPAIIGEHSRIINAYIGPFTSIYHHVVIENAEVSRSIVLEYSQIRDLDQRIEDSLIGRHVVIQRSPIRPRAYKFTLGDHSQLGLLGNG
jgi:glucose-1-phosphate thymidylyltransferase